MVPIVHKEIRQFLRGTILILMPRNLMVSIPGIRFSRRPCKRLHVSDVKSEYTEGLVKQVAVLSKTFCRYLNFLMHQTL